MTKTFKTEVVLSVVDGHLLCDFSDMQECIEFVAGHPVWTHELINNDLMQPIKDHIYNLHPQLKDFDGENIDKDNYKIYVEQAIKQFGNNLELTSLENERLVSPIATAIETFGEDKVVVVEKE